MLAESLAPTLTRWPLRHGEIVRARVEDVYPTIETGSVSLAQVDGPYALKKGDWDDVEDLAAWYRPHLEEVSRVCAPAASLYLWGSEHSWALVHPVALSLGWTYRCTITWDKGIAMVAGNIDTATMRMWPVVTEVCGFYQRGGLDGPSSAAQLVGYAAGADEGNWIREWLAAEWSGAGLRMKDADAALGTNGMAGHYFGRSQWSLPTLEAYERLAAHAARHGAPRERPWLVHPDAGEGLRASWDHLREGFDRLRASWTFLRDAFERARPPFSLPSGVTNVWSHPLVGGAERLKHRDGSILHPCQKPLVFARRMIEASSRPGELVFEPFGGTCRLAAAGEQLGRYRPEEARRYLCVEADGDGRDYVDHVLASLRGEPPALPGTCAQAGLFDSVRR